MRECVELCVGEEHALWARRHRGAAEAHALGWLHPNLHPNLHTSQRPSGSSSASNALSAPGDAPVAYCAASPLFGSLLEDHLDGLFDLVYHHARKHVVRRVHRRPSLYFRLCLLRPGCLLF